MDAYHFFFFYFLLKIWNHERLGGTLTHESSIDLKRCHSREMLKRKTKEEITVSTSMRVSSPHMDVHPDWLSGKEIEHFLSMNRFTRGFINATIAKLLLSVKSTANRGTREC